jgi:hypothetical protein
MLSPPLAHDATGRGRPRRSENLGEGEAPAEPRCPRIPASKELYSAKNLFSFRRSRLRNFASLNGAKPQAAKRPYLGFPSKCDSAPDMVTEPHFPRIKKAARWRVESVQPWRRRKRGFSSRQWKRPNRLAGSLRTKLLHFEGPQAVYRPQTACGRYCPWEPTALNSFGRLCLSPLIVTATIMICS